MYYIAYGSNIPSKQMKARCKDANFVGSGVLKDYELNFCYHADVNEKKGKEVEVVVWDISKEDEDILDMYEGYPTYYGKHLVEVEMKNGGKIKGLIYEMKENRKIPSPPSISYYEIIKDGYKEYDLNIKCLVNSIHKIGGILDKIENKYIY